MKILHTADWHLGDRLGRIDRTKDLERALAHIGELCLEEQIDVLLVAGDLFSELSRPDSLRASIERLAQVFVPFLTRGGTILAVTGNHDNENFCQTLCHVIDLASPASGGAGALVPAGRFYLAAAPTFLRLEDRAGMPVQFVLMPYPTATRYLDDGSRRYQGLAEKNSALHRAFAARLELLRRSSAFDASQPAVLAAHVHVEGARLRNAFRLTDEESVVVAGSSLPADWTYVALGHIHRPQALLRAAHVRYSGSIERLDLGEADDQKQVVTVDIGPEGLRDDPITLALDARPIYEVVITNPREEISRLRERYPDADRALVRCHVIYEAGKDIINEVLAQLDLIFPFWYERAWTEAGCLPQASDGGLLGREGHSFRETVLGYLEREWQEHRERDELRRLAESLLTDEESGAIGVSASVPSTSSLSSPSVEQEAGEGGVPAAESPDC